MTGQPIVGAEVRGGGDNGNVGSGLGSTTSRKAGLAPFSDVSDELELRDASSADTEARRWDDAA